MRYLDRLAAEAALALIAAGLPLSASGLHADKADGHFVGRAGYCGCGRRISDNKASCYACKLEAENAAMRARIAELEASGEGQGSGRS